MKTAVLNQNITDSSGFLFWFYFLTEIQELVSQNLSVIVNVPLPRHVVLALVGMLGLSSIRVRLPSCHSLRTLSRHGSAAPF